MTDTAERFPDKPWLAAIPRADVESFSGGFDRIDRPISHGDRPALIVIDMTREFVDSAYPTGSSETAGPAIDSIANLLAAARAGDVPVYFTKGFADPQHTPIRGEAGRWKTSRTPVSRAADLPPGDVIVDELEPRPGEIVIHKQRKPSAFFGTPLAALLIADGVDTVIVTGMTTSGCVRASVLDAFQYNLHVLVVQEACADRSQISHDVTLFDVHMKYADVIREQDAVAILSARRPGRSDATAASAATA
jgi:nicotinamidase-related amidase